MSGSISPVCFYENFLFTDTSKNDCFTKVLEVINSLFKILGLGYIKQEVLLRVILCKIRKF